MADELVAVPMSIGMEVDIADMSMMTRKIHRNRLFTEEMLARVGVKMFLEDD